MKLGRSLLAGILLGTLALAAQGERQEEQRRIQEIQAKIKQGVQPTQEERQFFKEVQARRRAEYAREHPPRESTGLVPLPDLGNGTYNGEQGGLYPGGESVAPAPHWKAGLKLAREIVPLDAEGRRAKDGWIVLLSIGMSNTTMEFQAFQKLAADANGLNPRLKIVDGAQGGQTAAITANPQSHFWEVVSERLGAAGVAAKQVEAAWIKQANAGPTAPFPAEAKKLEADLVETLHNLHDKFPNLKITYLSSRIYAGYAVTPLNPEPHAYETAFAVKWVIAGQMAGKPGLNFDPRKGTVRAPWTAWGPCLWADGVKGRRQDSLVWLREDLAEDGTHPSMSGRGKVAKLLLDFFRSDATARPWFLAK